MKTGRFGSREGRKSLQNPIKGPASQAAVGHDAGRVVQSCGASRLGLREIDEHLIAALPARDLGSTGLFLGGKAMDIAGFGPETGLQRGLRGPRRPLEPRFDDLLLPRVGPLGRHAPLAHLEVLEVLLQGGRLALHTSIGLGDALLPDVLEGKGPISAAKQVLKWPFRATETLSTS